jgi:hypothetical protein
MNRLLFHDFKISYYTKKCSIIYNVRFFYWIFIFFISFLLSVISTCKMDHVTLNEHFWLYFGYLIPFFISFCGSFCLLFYFFWKSPRFLIYIIPFCIVTAIGLMISATQFMHLNTAIQWPLHFTTDSLLYYISLLLTPTMTFLLLPFIRKIKKSKRLISDTT